MRVTVLFDRIFVTRFFAINIFWLITTLLVFLLLVKLGFWQLTRADEKFQRLHLIEQYQTAEKVDVNNLFDGISKHHQLTEYNDVAVQISGEFLSAPLFLLDNQMQQGRFGYQVLQLMQLSQPITISAELKHYVLINLGWLAGDSSRQTLPAVKPYQGRMEINGNIRLIEKGIVLAEDDWHLSSTPIVIQTVDLIKIAKLTSKQLMPFVVYLDSDMNIGYSKTWQPIVMPPEKHQGYAFQWFSLAIAWLALMFFAAIKASKQHG